MAARLGLMGCHGERVYPASVRGTALGLASGIGRAGSIVGPAVTGGLVTAGLGYPWGFYFFCAVALLAVIAMVAVPRGMEAWADDGESSTTASSADLLQERHA